jgi:hypothetical protein
MLAALQHIWAAEEEERLLGARQGTGYGQSATAAVQTLDRGSPGKT